MSGPKPTRQPTTTLLRCRTCFRVLADGRCEVHGQINPPQIERPRRRRPRKEYALSTSSGRRLQTSDGRRIEKSSRSA